MKKNELLAPAGNMESYHSAVNNGADSIYLGGKFFNAREMGDNFSNEEIILIIEHAHYLGKKVYITVNTLVKENELEEVFNYIIFLHVNNADGIIIQDLGLLKLLFEKYPEINLNASTQMTICDYYGVNILERYGIKKVILSREITLGKIEEIKKHTKIELEFFIHGALCCSYSGQCYMSAMFGGRSANRGKCAQPCRLPYGIFIGDIEFEEKENLYPLSLKELSIGKDVSEIIDAGIDTLKIEGRMRKPSYTGAVTDYYRKIMDKQDYDEEKIIADEIFSRGFTKGIVLGDFGVNLSAYTNPKKKGIVIGKITKKHKYGFEVFLKENLMLGDGIAIISKGVEKGFLVTEMTKNNVKITSAKPGEIVYLGSPFEGDMHTVVYKTYNKEMNDRFIYSDEIKLPVKMKIKIKIGEKALIEAWYKDYYAAAYSDDPIEKAKSSKTDRDILEKQISKLGDTIFFMESGEYSFDEEAFVSKSVLNNIRREAIDSLKEQLVNKTVKRAAVKFSKSSNKNKKPELSLKIHRTTEIIEEFIRHYRRIYIPYYILNEKIIDMISGIDLEIYLFLEDIGKNFNYIEAEKVINKYNKNIQGLLVDNLDGLGFAQKFEGLKVMTDFNMNIINSYGVYFLEGEKVAGFTHSIESNLENIRNINFRTNIENECILYSRIPVMTIRNCPLAVVNNCADESKCSSCNIYEEAFLVDRKDMKITLDRIKGITKTFNPVPLYMIDRINELENINIDYLRVELGKNDDLAKITDDIIKSYGNISIEKPEEYTRGFYYKELL